MPAPASRHWPLFLRCLATVAVFRLGLCLMPYRRLARWIPAVADRTPTRPEIKRLMWAVKRTARMVPRATCLTQALAAQYLCARAGYPAHIRIGVARDENGGIGAHAWLIDDRGMLLIGGTEDLGRFTPIVDLGNAGQ